MKYTNEYGLYGNTVKRRPADGRGPVETHSVSSLSGSQSRALNHIEGHPKVKMIAELMELQVERAREKAAHKYLMLLRAQLRDFNLSRHHLRINAAMGSVFIEVIDEQGRRKLAEDLPGQRLAVRVIKELDQFLDGSWEWAAYLDKEYLTEHSLHVC